MKVLASFVKRAMHDGAASEFVGIDFPVPICPEGTLNLFKCKGEVLSWEAAVLCGRWAAPTSWGASWRT